MDAHDQSPLRRAINEAGGSAKLAAHLGITTQAISQWDRVPVQRVLDICRIPGVTVTPHDLRPDIYPADPHRQDAAD